MRKINLGRWFQAIFKDTAVSAQEARIISTSGAICDPNDGTHWYSYKKWSGMCQVSAGAIKRVIGSRGVDRWLVRVLIGSKCNRRKYVYICAWPDEDRVKILENMFDTTGFYYDRTRKCWTNGCELSVQSIMDQRHEYAPEPRLWTTPHRGHTQPGIIMIPGNEDQNEVGDHYDPRENKPDDNQGVTPGIIMIPEGENPENPGDHYDPLYVLKEQIIHSECVYILSTYMGSIAQCTHTHDSFCKIENQIRHQDPCQDLGEVREENSLQENEEPILNLFLSKTDASRETIGGWLWYVNQTYNSIGQSGCRKKILEMFGRTTDRKALYSMVAKTLVDSGIDKISQEQAQSLIAGLLLRMKLSESVTMQASFDDEKMKATMRTIPSLTECCQMIDSIRLNGDWTSIQKEILEQVPRHCQSMNWNRGQFNLGQEFAKKWGFVVGDFKKRQAADAEIQQARTPGESAKPKGRVGEILERFPELDIDSKFAAKGDKRIDHDNMPLPQIYWMLGAQDRVLGKLNSEEARLIGWIGDVPDVLDHKLKGGVRCA